MRYLQTGKTQQTGSCAVSFSTTGLPAGLYYLQLFEDKELVHFHELEIK
jgi:hypothetical protein